MKCFSSKFKHRNVFSISCSSFYCTSNNATDTDWLDRIWIDKINLDFSISINERSEILIVFAQVECTFALKEKLCKYHYFNVCDYLEYNDF